VERLSTTVVSAGTTHPRNAAGLGRDARVAADWGIAHVMAVAAVTAQDERGVHEVFALPPGVMRSQLGAIDFRAARAVRVGALGSRENAIVTAEFLQAAQAPVVFDPVMFASAGGCLYTDDAYGAVRGFLNRVSAIVTPNIQEAQQLTGIAIADVDDMIEAGKQFVERGARAALIKGGHLPGDPVDVLVEAGGHVQRFADSRVRAKMSGTGCALAMALACELALGHDLPRALQGARAYVRENLARAS
jgi:hydroxymethylpyrimidine kinase/phosphomethylpyrimidine kinase